MKELLDKISSYNIFNYLFPGIVFVVVLKQVTKYNLIQDNITLGVFLYYFIGLIISRIGSLVIEPFLKKISFLKFSDYEEFVITSKIDDKIEILSEANNMYRTICSMLLFLLIAIFYEFLENKIDFLQNRYFVLIIVLLLLFLFSYRKQTNYITKRIDTNKQNAHNQ